MRVKSLGLDDIVAGDPKPAGVSHLLAALVRASSGSATRCREQKYRAIGHHTVNVEQHELDLFRAFAGHGESVAAGSTLFAIRLSPKGSSIATFVIRPEACRFAPLTTGRPDRRRATLARRSGGTCCRAQWMERMHSVPRPDRRSLDFARNDNLRLK